MFAVRKFRQANEDVGMMIDSSFFQPILTVATNAKTKNQSTYYILSRYSYVWQYDIR